MCPIWGDISLGGKPRSDRILPLSQGLYSAWSVRLQGRFGIIFRIQTGPSSYRFTALETVFDVAFMGTIHPIGIAVSSERFITVRAGK